MQVKSNKLWLPRQSLIPVSKWFHIPITGIVQVDDTHIPMVQEPQASSTRQPKQKQTAAGKKHKAALAALAAAKERTGRNGSLDEGLLTSG